MRDPAVQPAAGGHRRDQGADAEAGRGPERQGADEHPVRRRRVARRRDDTPTVYVLEVNPRASRTVPFVSKATGVPLARLAALVMVGKTLDELGVTDEVVPTHFSVKESVFPFNKFPGVDIILGPEMQSTGEVMGIDDDFPMAFAKARWRRSAPLPKSGTVFVSVAEPRQGRRWCRSPGQFAEMGYKLIATRGTATVLRERGHPGRGDAEDRRKAGRTCSTT